MEYRIDKRSGNELSVLGMGCMRLPRKGPAIDMQLTELIVLEAFERGINYFDTAYSYGGSEEALNERIYRLVNIIRHEVKELCPVVTAVVGSAVQRMGAIADSYKAAADLLKKVR